MVVKPQPAATDSVYWRARAKTARALAEWLSLSTAKTAMQAVAKSLDHFADLSDRRAADNEHTRCENKLRWAKLRLARSRGTKPPRQS